MAEILGICSVDIVLVSERDGTFRGHQELEKYLREHKFEGKWQSPKVMDSQRTYVNGVVNAFWMDWNVVGVMEFDQEKRLIERIELKRGHID